MKRILLTSATVLLVGLSQSMPSSAQMKDGGMGMKGGGCAMMTMMAGGMKDLGKMAGGMKGHDKKGGGQQSHMAARTEARLDLLKSNLAITDSQAESWNDYAKAVTAQAASMQQAHASMMSAMDKGTAVERIDARITGMQAVIAALTALKPAIEKLYGDLTPEQRATADDLIGMGCGGV